ncbi:MAG: hypothetical protein R3229_12305 [Alphaproteobacteria bacterium]|nr:hypothetical protein [Alphaproteobacteria bacterium]
MAKDRRRIFALAALALVLAAAAMVGALGQRGSGHGPRYDKIARVIVKNLEVSRHFTRAVTGGTIKRVLPLVTVGDVAVLERMLGDENGKLGVAAAVLLTLLGAPGEAALKRAARSADVRTSLRARDGLLHLGQCRDPRIGNLDRDLCPAAPDGNLP